MDRMASVERVRIAVVTVQWTACEAADADAAGFLSVADVVVVAIGVNSAGRDDRDAAALDGCAEVLVLVVADFKCGRWW